MGETRPWQRAYPPGLRWDVAITPQTVPALLDDAVADWAERPVLRFRDTRLTCAALRARVDALAAGLLARGIGPGSTVALYLPNTLWHPVCFLALARAGARIVHLSALDARRELAHKLADSGARVLVTTDQTGLLAQALALLEDDRADTVFVAPDGAWGGPPGADIPWSDRVQDLRGVAAPIPVAWPALRPEDVLLLQYTGGTTGLPKGAMLTHANLAAATAIYRAWTDNERAKPGEQRILGVLPLFHIYALSSVLLRNLRDGNELFIQARFDAETAVATIERERITGFPGVPTMWIGLLNLPGIATRDFSSLRSFSSGGAPMPFDVVQKLETLLGGRMGGGWGMTETSPAGARIPPHAPSRAGIIGLPLPAVDMAILSTDDRRKLPAGEVGEIAIRGPNVFAGYWNQPEETARSFHDGWFLTGDMGWMDADGYFTLVDRRKNMIISGGFNVYPAALEQAIYEHPDVAECLVIGIPDAYRGQAAKAFVALRAGRAPFTLEALQEFLRERVGRHEMPRALEFRDALPRSTVGKLLASVLRDEEAAKGDQHGSALHA